MAAAVGASPPPPRLFTTHLARGRLLYKLYFFSFVAAFFALMYYRLTHVPSGHRLLWFGAAAAELGFGVMWLFQQGFRWAPTFHTTYPERLPKDDLPAVDVFICTADAEREPPVLVANTLLSLMALDYDPARLAYYLSDDGVSELTFHAAYLAGIFARDWLPFCRKYRVEQPAPEEYFSEENGPAVGGQGFLEDYASVKRKFEDMKQKIAYAASKGRVPDELKNEHKGYKEWSKKLDRGDHQSIVEVILRGKGDDKDVEGQPMPTLVYVSREKRPSHPHHYKAGALNALNRVSSIFSNAPFILNVDCDMKGNNREALHHAMCFFLDPNEGNQIAYAQFPQSFGGITKNDVYGNSNKRIFEIELFGMNAFNGPSYIGTNSVHRRESLNGRQFSPDFRFQINNEIGSLSISWSKSEITAKEVISCTYETGKTWGKEMGLMYDCAVEDVYTGIVLQSRGWRSIYFSPKRIAFLGLGPANTNDSLIQHKRWSTGLMEIFLSEYSPLLHGFGKLKLGQIMCYSFYTLWCLWSLPMIYYAIIPALSISSGFTLFPKVSSPWFKVFAFIAISSHAFSLIEILLYDGTLKMWWNEVRIWMMKGPSSYFYALTVVIMKSIGFGEPGFEITSKIMDDEAKERYMNEVMEFGVASPMFIPFTTLSLLNLVAFIKCIFNTAVGMNSYENSLIEISISGFISLVSFPLYHALFLRKDKGRMPTSITLKSIIATSILYYLFTHL